MSTYVLIRGAADSSWHWHLVAPELVAWATMWSRSTFPEQAEEVYVVLSGSGRVKLDDEVVELDALDAVRVAPAVPRAFEAGPDGLELLAFGSRHEGDGEVVEDWWVG